MTTIRSYKIGGPNGNNGGNPFGIVGSLIMMIIGLILAYLVVKGIFTLLLWFSIPLFIAGVAVDPKGALKLGKSMITLAKKSPLVPIAILVIASIFYSTVPFILLALTGGGLLAKFLLKRKMNAMFGGAVQTKEEDEEFTEFEEVVEEEDFLELPEIETNKQSKTGESNEYDNLFD